MSGSDNKTSSELEPSVLPEDQAITKNEFSYFFDSRGYTNWETGFMSGLRPTQVSDYSNADMDDHLEEISRSILVRVYNNYPFLLEQFDSPTFKSLYEDFKRFFPDIRETELAEILGSTKQNGRRWMSAGEISKPTLKRLAKSIEMIIERYGQVGAEQIVESARHEYKLEGKPHDIRSVEQMENDYLSKKVVESLTGLFPNITNREIALLCGASEKIKKDEQKERSDKLWRRKLDLSDQNIKDMSVKLIELIEAKNSEAVCKLVLKRIDELSENGIKKNLRSPSDLGYDSN